MATTLSDMRRNNVNAFGSSQNIIDVDAIIQEIKQDVIGMDKHLNDYMRRVDDATREYKKEVTATMAKLTRMVS